MLPPSLCAQALAPRFDPTMDATMARDHGAQLRALGAWCRGDRDRCVESREPRTPSGAAA